MMPATEGFARLDERRRISIGRFTNLEPGSHVRVRVNEDGSLAVKPVEEEDA